MVYIDRLYEPINGEDYYRYLGDIFLQWQKIKKIKLDQNLIEIIRYFIHNRYGYAYECLKYLEKNKIKITRRIVDRIIKNLCYFGILTVINKGEVKDTYTSTTSGRIYHEITPFGIFYIMNNKTIGPDIKEEFKTLFDNYENNILFKSMLYRIIPFNILKGLKSTLLWDSIITFIEDYLRILEELFRFVDKQTFLLSSINQIEGIVNPYAWHPNPMIKTSTNEILSVFDHLLIRKLCNESGKPYYSIKEKKQKDFKNNVDIITISSSNGQKIDHMTKLIVTNTNEIKIKVFRNRDHTNNNPDFEFDILSSSLKPIPSEYSKLCESYFIPFTYGDLIGTCESYYLNKFFNNHIKLILDISYIKYSLTPKPVYDDDYSDEKQFVQDMDKILGENDIDHDMKRLYDDNAFMNFFNETQEFTKSILENFKNNT